MRSLAVAVLALLWVPVWGQDREYEIGPGDVVHVAVLGQADMTGDFTVVPRQNPIRRAGGHADPH